MKPSLSLLPLTAALLLADGFALSSRASSPPPIPMDQLGAVAGKEYQGDGLAVRATATGAELRCAFQRLEGEVTAEGLWLWSTADHCAGERFRVLATGVGRTDDFGVRRQSVAATPLWPGAGWTEAVGNIESGVALRFPPQTLSFHGTVTVSDEHVRFLRPGVTEEYSVSVDGVRQDFLITQPPAGTGELRVELDVTGATVEPLGNGARLTLSGSGRKLAYHHLLVTDATGRELPARMEVAAGILSAVAGAHPAARNFAANNSKANLPVTSESAGLEASTMRQAKMPAATKLAVLVDDANAVYPVRIDPTFSDADWISMGGIPGANSGVRAAVMDGIGNLYVGGDFTAIGEVTANRIAKWDGNGWSALGAGLNNQVYALVVSGSDLYAAGAFTTAGGTTANRIAKWNGSGWSKLGSGVNATVYTLAVAGTDLYVGGDFIYASGTSANRIAKWNGSSWNALGSGMNNTVRALAVVDSFVYAGGYFTTAGGIAANRIAKWDGSSWSALGSGMNQPVLALAVLGTNLFAGGGFTTAGGSPANYIAKWDGSWTTNGLGLNGAVWALAVAGSNIFAGGSFTAAGGSSANRIAKWNGTNWSALGFGIGGSSNPQVDALLVSGSNLYAAGFFTSAGVDAWHIAKWNGNSWSGLSSGMNNSVLALAVSDSNVYVGGSFTKVSGISVNRIAKWNGSSWSALDSGLNSDVYALAVSGTNLYAGGSFTYAGVTSVNRIAKWDGNSWSALGSGMSGGDSPRVYALAVSGTNLYAAGLFTAAGGSPANYVAKWDGSSWSGLGAGMSDGYPPSIRVYALATAGDDLYAAGHFSWAGGTFVDCVAKWDGNNWSALGSGLSEDVYALAVSGTNLYAGGSFTTSGGAPTDFIARWDGSAWSALGGSWVSGGVNGAVLALAVSGNDLYIGGVFRFAGGTTVNHMAKWDGSTWSALGSGMNNYVRALAVTGPDLYAGGDFITAGGKVSAYAAKANIGAAQGRFSEFGFYPATGFSCTFLDASVGQPYRIQSSPSLAGPWTDFTNFVYAGPVVINDPSALSGTNKFFRAVTP